MRTCTVVVCDYGVEGLAEPIKVFERSDDAEHYVAMVTETAVHQPRKILEAEFIPAGFKR